MPTKPLLSLDDLSDYDARKDLPPYLRDLRQVHEEYRDNGTPMPDYRSHMFCDFDTKIDEQRFRDLLVRYCKHPRITSIYDRLRRYSRPYQVTVPGLVKQFNARAGREITLGSFNAGVNELRKLGLIETVPLASCETRSTKAGLVGSITRIKRRDQWPKPFNPDGMTLDEIEAQPGYSKQKGRIKPSVHLGEFGRKNRKADAFIFDVYTGEVIERETGAILHVYDWKVRDKWKAFKFVRKFLAQEGSKVRGLTQPIYIKDIDSSLNEESPFPVPGLEPRFQASFFSSPDSIDPADGEAGLQEQYAKCTLDEEELTNPVAAAINRDSFKQAQDLFEQTLIPESEDEWEVSGRYDPIHNGTLNLHNHKIPGGAEAYLTGSQYTDTDVSRWLHNSYEGTLLRRAVRYELLEPKEQIKIGKIWMRRFTNARRKDAHYQTLRVSGAHVKPGDVYHDNLVRRLEQMVILNCSRDWKYQSDKSYTSDELSDFKKTYRLHVTDDRWTMVDDLCHELQNRELARQTKLHALGVDGLKAELKRRADEIGQRLLSGDFEEWTPCFKEGSDNRVSWKVEDQERWVVTMFAALQSMEEIERTPHAAKAVAYIGDLMVCASRSWKLAAISDTSMGDALMANFAHFEDLDSCVAPLTLAAFRQRFARFFEVYPAEVLFDAKCMDRALNTTTTARNPDIDRNWLAKRRTEIVLETARRANGLPDYSPINIYTLRVTPCHVLSMN